MRRSLRFLTTGLAAISTLALAVSASARDRRVDPQVLRALDTGIVSPQSLRMGTPQPGKAPVIVELAATASAANIEALEARGVQVRRVDGRVLSYGRFVPAIVTEASLSDLLSFSLVRAVRNPPSSGGLRPLDHSAALMDLAPARGARPALDLLTGEGMVIADLDGNADVFHPQFFRADAGWFDWLDVDDDGVFTPGTDAVDLDRDGAVGGTEIGMWVEAKTIMLFYGDEVGARSSGFDPAIDWVYLDENDNGRRDYGAANGFDDTAPALGEPLFVPDDVNQNGKLDVGERLARLGTSKFAKVYVHVEYYADVDHIFERGVDLSTHVSDYTGGVHGYSDALHATGVLSIVAADVPLVGRRWVGVAPDADLLLGYEIAQEESKTLTWALAEEPDAMLHEVALWTGEPMDGSDTYSAMVDASVADDGVTHTCPTGNLGGSRKHANIDIPAGGNTTADLDVPSHGAYYIQISLSFRGGSDVGVVLREPGGTEHDITGGPGYAFLSTGASLYTGSKTSSRGTEYWDMLLYVLPADAATKPIPSGGWELDVANQGPDAITLDAYVMDNASGWGLGVAWAPSIATDASTAGIPAISDNCIAVGAHTGHPSTPSEPWFNAGPEGPGELRAYSGRGPRIDGEQKPDLLAPDNPWSAAPNDLNLSGSINPHGSVWPLGGTSGATPHVTGVTALMAQAGITGLDARDALRASAVNDGLPGTAPSEDYGWGRLNAALALGAEPGGKAPTVELSAAPPVVNPGQQVTLEVTASDPDDGDALEAKWDDGYDGEWASYGPVEARTLSFDEVGRYPFKVRVRDSAGRFAEAVVWVDVKDGPIEPPDAGADASDGAGGSGGSSASDAGTGSDGASGSTASAGATSDDGGCGCRTRPGRPSGAGLGLLLAAIAMLARRGRCRRVRPDSRLRFP